MRPRFTLVEDRDPHERRIRSRMLPGSADAPALEILEGLPEGRPVGPSLLFVHGAFGGAWNWNEVFLPYLVARGHHVIAFSIRGHGTSDGYENLREWSLRDYLEDVRRVLAELPEPPVIIGHSLGGLLAQMLVGRARLRGLVLLASLPPEGLLFVGPRLSVTDPHIWTEAFAGSIAKARAPIQAAAHQILFSEGLPQERVRRYASLMTPESPRALLDAHLPGPIVPAAWHGLPTLVISGGVDRLVWGPSALRTALYHGGEYHRAEEMGHFLQLDIGAEGIAARLRDWLHRRGLASQ